MDSLWLITHLLMYGLYLADNSAVNVWSVIVDISDVNICLKTNLYIKD